MLTCNQYLEGFYSAREAVIIATLFSAVSITFSLVVLSQVGLTEMFGIFYLLVCVVGIVCAFVCPRIYPLRRKKIQERLMAFLPRRGRALRAHPLATPAIPPEALSWTGIGPTTTTDL